MFLVFSRYAVGILELLHVLEIGFYALSHPASMIFGEEVGVTMVVCTFVGPNCQTQGVSHVFHPAVDLCRSVLLGAELARHTLRWGPL